MDNNTPYTTKTLTQTKKDTISKWLEMKKPENKDVEVLVITAHLDRIIEYLAGMADQSFYDKENYTTPKQWGNFAPSPHKFWALEYAAYFGIYADTLRTLCQFTDFPYQNWQYEQISKV